MPYKKQIVDALKQANKPLHKQSIIVACGIPPILSDVDNSLRDLERLNLIRKHFNGRIMDTRNGNIYYELVPIQITMRIIGSLPKLGSNSYHREMSANINGIIYTCKFAISDMKANPNACDADGIYSQNDADDFYLRSKDIYPIAQLILDDKKVNGVELFFEPSAGAKLIGNRMQYTTFPFICFLNR